MVYNVEVKMGQVLYPIGLPVIEKLARHKIFEVLMIAQNLNQVKCSFKLWAPFLKCVDNGYELFVIDHIVVFSGAVFLGEKGDGVENAVVVIVG
jgi:hypothetical protein